MIFVAFQNFEQAYKDEEFEYPNQSFPVMEMKETIDLGQFEDEEDSKEDKDDTKGN